MSEGETPEYPDLEIETPRNSVDLAQFLQAASARFEDAEASGKCIEELGDEKEKLQLALDIVLDQLLFLLEYPNEYPEATVRPLRMYESGGFSFEFKLDDEEINLINVNLSKLLEHFQDIAKGKKSLTRKDENEIFEEIIDVIRSCDPASKIQGTRQEIRGVLLAERKKERLVKADRLMMISEHLEAAGQIKSAISTLLKVLELDPSLPRINRVEKELQRLNGLVAESVKVEEIQWQEVVDLIRRDLRIVPDEAAQIEEDDSMDE